MYMIVLKQSGGLLFDEMLEKTRLHLNKIFKK